MIFSLNQPRETFEVWNCTVAIGNTSLQERTTKVAKVRECLITQDEAAILNEGASSNNPSNEMYFRPDSNTVVIGHGATS
jgi:hypothetical protein